MTNKFALDRQAAEWARLVVKRAYKARLAESGIVEASIRAYLDALAAQKKAQPAADGYLVSTSQIGERRWWAPGEQIPAEHVNVRLASAQVAALAARVMSHDRAGRMPSPGLGMQLSAALDAAEPWI